MEYGASLSHHIIAQGTKVVVWVKVKSEIHYWTICLWSLAKTWTELEQEIMVSWNRQIEIQNDQGLLKDNGSGYFNVHDIWVHVGMKLKPLLKSKLGSLRELSTRNCVFHQTGDYLGWWCPLTWCWNKYNNEYSLYSDAHKPMIIIVFNLDAATTTWCL